MKKTILSILAFAVLIILASCAEKRAPLEVLNLADSVTKSVNSLEFDVVREYKEKNNYIKDTVKVFVKRRKMDIDPIGLSIRYEYKDGMKATFNGLEYRYLVNSEKKVVFADTADGAFRIIAGNWIMGAINLMLTNYSNYEELAKEKDSLKNSGAEVIRDEKTFRITFQKFYKEYNVNSNDVFNIGIDDWIPRRYTNTSVIDKDTVFRKYDYLNIKINPNLNDEMFSLKVPDGYALEKHKSEEVAQPLPTDVMAPAFELNDVNGKLINSESFKGKVTVIDFWGTWCRWCVKAMPELQKLNLKYASNKKVNVLGISCQEPADANPKKFLEENKVTYNSLLKGDEVAKKFSVTGFPTLFVIGKDGKIAFQQSGFSENLVDTLSQIIDKELKK